MGPLFALFLRSIRDDVRARGTYILRSVLVGLILIILWITHLSRGWSGAVGRQFFSSVMTVNLIVLSLIGLSYFSSAITEEKEDETLGLLRMTNLSSLSILLGKSTARVIGGLLFILVQLPFMLLALPMGGLRIVQILSGVSCLVGYALFLANFGLFASVLFRKTSSASLFAGIFLVPLAFGPRKVAGFFFRITGEFVALNPDWEYSLDAWTRATPVERTKELLATTFKGPVFEWQFFISLVAAIACLLAAWALFDRFSDARAESGRGRSARRRRGWFRSRVQHPAIAWKDYWYIAGGHAAAGMKLLLAVLFFFMAAWVTRKMPRSGDGALATFGFVLLLSSGATALLAVCLDASRIFRVERTERTLASLMVLPLATRRVIMHKIRGCLATSYPLFTCMAIGVACIALAAFPDLVKAKHYGEEILYFVCYAIYTLATWLSCPVFIGWLSLRMRWGAFLVGGTIWVLGNWVLAILCALIFREASAVILPFSALAFLGAFAASIPRRLEQLAAEE